MRPDVFISYSRENQQDVIKLVEYLRGQGLAVWMDESDIHGATMWTKEIVEAIRASSLFILAISRHSTGSKNVVKELALASEREKIILPIYLEQCDIPETMEYQLAGIQNIALFTLDKGKAYEFVHQTIRRLGIGQAQAEDQAEPAPSAGHGTALHRSLMVYPRLPQPSRLSLYTGVSDFLKSSESSLQWCASLIHAGAFLRYRTSYASIPACHATAYRSTRQPSTCTSR